MTRDCRFRLLGACVFVFLLSGVAEAFSVPPRKSSSSISTSALKCSSRGKQDESASFLPLIKSAAATAVLGVTLTFSAVPVQAFEESDYASDTVMEAVKSLDSANGDADKTFSAFEGIASIITEGRGVGGQINYEGVSLERGYVADEDTTIYNPGLSLLTESEKERLVKAAKDARSVALSKSTWTDNNQVAYEFLKDKLDPLHMTELRGYLKIVPVFGAVLYLGTLAVQQFVRDLFPAAYIASAAAVFLPVAVLILLGS